MNNVLAYKNLLEIHELFFWIWIKSDLKRIRMCRSCYSLIDIFVETHFLLKDSDFKYYFFIEFVYSILILFTIITFAFLKDDVYKFKDVTLLSQCERKIISGAKTNRFIYQILVILINVWIVRKVLNMTWLAIYKFCRFKSHIIKIIDAWLSFDSKEPLEVLIIWNCCKIIGKILYCKS